MTLLVAPSLAQACVGWGSCPEFESPCPAPFDVGEWCENNAGCTVDGMPAQCLGGCQLKGGQVLSIPIREFAGSLAAFDLRVQGSNGGCSTTPEYETLLVTLDSSPGSPTRVDSDAFYTWDSFPQAPQVLDLQFGGGGCVRLALAFIDGPCEAENPTPECPQ